MNKIITVGLLAFLGIISPRQGVANPLAETVPGWSPWRQETDDVTVTYQAGPFSNGDALALSSWGLYCTEQAQAINREASYWFRFDHLIQQLGTGYVENGCLINGEMYTSGPLVAVNVALNNQACLQVNADIGNGLVLRKEPSTSSEVLGILPNGTTVGVESLPHAIYTDQTGRQWLRVDQPQFGWVSAAARAGAYINLQRCS
ncbi:MAG: SH3 domain-containing protein [Cyanobacteria bacterium P01_G01_bin.54]